nr:hypothetical protein [Chryseobacterium wanjuense]
MVGSFNFAQEIKSSTVQDSVQLTKDVQEVLIKAQRKKQFVDKAIYTFDDEALKKARYANDLLQTLPELQFDPISSSISSIKGGKFLLLINGVESTESQARGIRPENVIRVEYYDNPPTRPIRHRLVAFNTFIIKVMCFSIGLKIISLPSSPSPFFNLFILFCILYPQFDLKKFTYCNTTILLYQLYDRY